MDNATSTLSYVLQMTETLDEPSIEAVILAKIAVEYSALNQSERTINLLSQALELANSEGRISARSFSLVMIAHSYGILGQCDNALQITNSVEPDLFRDQVQQALTCSQDKSSVDRE